MDRRIENNTLSDVSSDEELDNDNMNVIEEVHDNQDDNQSHPNRGREVERKKDENRKRKRSSSYRSKSNRTLKRSKYDRSSASHKRSHLRCQKPKHHQAHKRKEEHTPTYRFELSPCDANDNHEMVRNVVLNLILSSGYLELPLKKVIITIGTEVLTTFKLEYILSIDNHSRFNIKNEFISLKTTLRVCLKHGNTGVDHDYCNDLHICKYDLVSRCDVPSCAFNHDLDTPHNKRVLKLYGLSSVSEANIRKIASDVRSRNSTTLPLICKFYQNYNGCQKGNTCTCLHICRHFIQDKCTRHGMCKRSHDLHHLLNSKLLHQYGLNTRNCNPFDLKAALLTSAIEPDINSDSPARRSSPSNCTNNQRHYNQMTTVEYRFNAEGTSSTKNVDIVLKGKTIVDTSIPEKKTPLRDIITENIIVTQDETISMHFNNRDTTYPGVTINQEELSDLEEGELRCDDLVSKNNTYATITKEDLGTSHECLPTRSLSDRTNLTPSPNQLVHESCLLEQSFHQLAEKNEGSSNNIKPLETELFNSGQTSDMNADKEVNEFIITCYNKALVNMDKDTILNNDVVADLIRKDEQQKIPFSNCTFDEIDKTLCQNEDNMTDSNNEDKLLETEAIHGSSLDENIYNDSPQKLDMGEVQSDDNLPESILVSDTFAYTNKEAKPIKNKQRKEEIDDLRADSTTMTQDKDDIKETSPIATPVTKVSSLRLPAWRPISKSRDFIPLDVTHLTYDKDNINHIQITKNVKPDGNVNANNPMVVSEHADNVEKNAETPSSTINVKHDGRHYELQRSGKTWRRKTKDSWMDLGHGEVVATETFLQTISQSH